MDAREVPYSNSNKLDHDKANGGLLVQLQMEKP